MNFASLPWHRPWIEGARGLAATRHHAWLLVGRPGDGLADAGAALASSLLCLDPSRGSACGQCPSCRWLAGDVHPDFKLLQPDLGDGETVKLPTIKIDVVRNALDFMQLSAAGAAGRVLLVDPATALARESANALLKALEEPPPNTRWILVTGNPERLLPTIRSRALRMDVPRPTTQQGLEWLASAGVTQDAARYLQMARGEPLTALQLARSESGSARDDFVRDLLRPHQLPTLKWGAWVEAGPKAERRERFASLLRILLDWTSDWARVRSALPAIIHSAQQRELAGLASGLPLAEALRYHRLLLTRLNLPDTTLSARLQLEAILLDYRSLFAR